jgi:hypothetical protein
VTGTIPWYCGWDGVGDIGPDEMRDRKCFPKWGHPGACQLTKKAGLSSQITEIISAVYLSRKRMSSSHMRAETILAPINAALQHEKEITKIERFQFRETTASYPSGNDQQDLILLIIPV